VFTAKIAERAEMNKKEQLNKITEKIIGVALVFIVS
jgi:hypothetical protein